MANPAHTLFISDLHLDAVDSKLFACFENFLQTQARKADALYILGDLFEVWTHHNVLSQQVAHALRALVAAGVPVYFMVGNRDFLVDKTFSQAAGVTVLPDPSVIQLYGRALLLKHGDDLCTADKHHQRFTAWVRHPITLALLRRLPVGLRQRLGQWARAVSQRGQAEKSAIEMDVTAAAVQGCFRQAGPAVALLIHGHTHKPDLHVLFVAGQTRQRIVLGAWHGQGHALRYPALGAPTFVQFD